MCAGPKASLARTGLRVELPYVCKLWPIAVCLQCHPVSLLAPTAVPAGVTLEHIYRTALLVVTIPDPQDHELEDVDDR